ncbi:MAG: hypothetical protein AAF389_15435 [Gemmatimonadota bacterium]
MDYRALAELVMMSLLGLSTLVFAVGLSVRLFLAPTLRELFGNKKSAPDPLDRHLANVDARLDSIDESLDRLLAAADFDRELDGASPKLMTDGE